MVCFCIPPPRPSEEEKRKGWLSRYWLAIVLGLALLWLGSLVARPEAAGPTRPALNLSMRDLAAPHPAPVGPAPSVARETRP